MPKITILTITTRYMYREEQIDALKAQTLRDFEWVMVDDVYRQEHEKMLDMIGNSFSFIHLLPKTETQFYAAAQAFNTALVAANGELVYFMNDYTVPEPNCLERHWQLHCEYPQAFFSGKRFGVDYLHKARENMEYYRKVNDDRIDTFNFLYRKELVNDTLFEGFPDDHGVRAWWAGRNDSAPLEAMVECNGFEELWDGERGWLDIDMAHRLSTLGLRYLFDSESICFELPKGPVEKLGGGRHAGRKVLEQMVVDKIRDKIYKSENGWSLRDARNNRGRLNSV